jgi:hypothetical protein
MYRIFYRCGCLVLTYASSVECGPSSGKYRQDSCTAPCVQPSTHYWAAEVRFIGLGRWCIPYRGCLVSNRGGFPSPRRSSQSATAASRSFSLKLLSPLPLRVPSPTRPASIATTPSPNSQPSIDGEGGRGDLHPGWLDSSPFLSLSLGLCSPLLCSESGKKRLAHALGQTN